MIEIENAIAFECPRYLVAITPREFHSNRFTIRECRQLVTASRVEIMGWALPFSGEDAVVGPGYIFEKTDLHGVVHHVEEWRLYRSGQFVHRSVPFELLEEDFSIRARALAEQNPHGGPPRTLVNVAGFVSFVALIYFVTMVYKFARQYALELNNSESLWIYVGLRDVENFALGSNDPALRLSSRYVVRMKSPYHAAWIPRQSLIDQPASHAAAAIESIFEQFNWDRSSATIMSHQKVFLR